MSYTGIPKEVMEAVAKSAPKPQKSTYIPGMPSSLQGYSPTNPAINTTPINNYGMPSGLPSSPTQTTPVNAYGMPSDIQNYLASKSAAPAAPAATPTAAPIVGGTALPKDNVLPKSGEVPATSTITEPSGVPNTDTVVDATPSLTWEDMYSQWQDLQKKKIYAQLDKSKSAALRALADEEAGLGPQYQGLRNQAAAASDVGAMNFAQYMAAQGVRGRAGAMPEIYRNAGLNNQIGAYNAQEQSERNRIARAKTGVETAYQSDLASAEAGLGAQALQDYMNQYNQDRMFRLQEAGVTGMYNNQPTQAAREFQANQDYRNRTFDENVRQFNIATGLDIRRLDFNEAQQIIDNELAARRLSLDERNQILQEMKFIKDQEAAEIKMSLPDVLKNYYDIGYTLKNGRWDGAAQKFTGQASDQQILNWLMSLNLDAMNTATLALSLGLDLNGMWSDNLNAENALRGAYFE